MALYQRLKRQVLSQVNLVRTALIVILVGGLLGGYWWVIRPLSGKIATLVKATQIALPKHNNRTNFLLLGMAGGDHAGATLTDTIIFASVDNTSGDTVLLSIPRDIWVATMKAKINTAYYYGQQKHPQGGGLVLAKSAISEAIGQPVDFAAAINFANFEKIIDLLGGVDVNVERSFEDHKFPIAGRENDLCDGDPQVRCRYEDLKFEAGLQHMNGQTALKFARSRQAEGEEGTDFARSKRQEKIILAIKQKVLSRQILTNPKLLRQLYDSVMASIETDVQPELYPALGKLALTASRSSLRTSSLSEDLFINPPVSALYNFQWVLVPKDQAISAYVENLLAGPTQK